MRIVPALKQNAKDMGFAVSVLCLTNKGKMLLFMLNSPTV